MLVFPFVLKFLSCTKPTVLYFIYCSVISLTLFPCFPMNRKLTRKTFNLKSYGLSSFSVSAPMLWNSLPSSLRTINDLETLKSRLKTHLFKQAFKTFA